MNRRPTIGKMIARGAALLLALLSVSGLFRAVPARAEDAPELVRVGYYENEVFQEGAEEGAVKTGYAYEYYRKLSEYTGWRYEYVYGGYGELYQMLLDGEIDLLAGLAWREERAGMIGYPDAVMGSEAYYLVKQDTETGITADPATLNGKTIGVLDSAMVGVLERFLEDHHVTAEVITYPDHEQLFSAFDSGELDVIAAESDGAHAREHAEVLCAFGYSDYYLCVNIRRPDLLAELNEAQTRLAAEEPNYLNSLSSKYYSVSVTARAFSAAEREWIETHDALSIGYLENYLPYSDTDGEGQVTGLLKDLVPEILNALGISGLDVSFRGYGSYDEMIAAMGSGAIDVAFPVGGGLYYSEENGIYQSNPVVSASTEIVFRGTYGEDTVSRFAVNENNRMQYYYIRTNYPDAEIVFYPSIDDCLAAVLSGEVGCTTLNGLRANDILKNGRYRDLSLHQTNRNDDRCFGVEIGNEGLLKLLNRGINVIGSEYAQNLSYRYTGGLYSYTFVDVLRDHTLLFGAVILAVTGLVFFFLIRDSRRKRKEVLEKEAAREALEEKNLELDKNRAVLSDALDAAEQANRAKTAFLSSMSHEIRTPMNAIIGLDSLALRKPDLDPQTRGYLEKIDSSAKHLLGLINDILDMSRIESGRMLLRKDTFSFRDMLEQINTMVSSQCDEKGLQYECSVVGGVSDCYVGDDMKLKQILINILSNAVKFTDAPGQITLTVERTASFEDQTTLKFTVKDTGIGIDKEFLPKIFDAFTQENSSRSSKYGSTGLGMAITKNLVTLMNGTITVESEKGVGTEFTVVLTLKNSDQGKPVPTSMRPEDMRVLIVDDEEIAAEHARIILDEAGIRSDICLSGAEALVKLDAAHKVHRPYNLVLLDWKMPEMDGLETAQEIRRKYDRETTVILLTSFNWDDIMDDALHAGVDSFLAKPLFASNVISEFERIARNNDMELFREKPRADLAGRRILLAEDILINAEIIKQIIEMKGAEIDHAENGKIALEMFARSEPGYYDAVLMDVRMPEMDGLEATAAIRALDREDARTVPIIAMTANAFDEDVQRSLQVGMNAHLSKPVEPEHLYQTLEELIWEADQAGKTEDGA